MFYKKIKKHYCRTLIILLCSITIKCDNLGDALNLLKTKLTLTAKTLKVKCIPFPLGLVDANKKLPNWEILITDIQKYKTSNTDHAGHPFQHMMWVEQTISNMLLEQDKNAPLFFWTKWLESLTERHKKIIGLAAFLHDIGKCGDSVYDFFTKGKHPEIGAMYLTEEKLKKPLNNILQVKHKRYKLSNKEKFDFDALFKELNINETEKKRITLLIAMHHEFGENMYLPTPDKYISKIQNIAQKLDYKEDKDFVDEKGNIQKSLVLLCILLSVADVLANQPVTGKASLLFSMPHPQKPVHKLTTCFYEKFNYATHGSAFRQKTIDFFKKKN